VNLAGRPIVDWLFQRLGSAVTDVCVVVDDLHGPIRRTVGDRRRGVRIHYALQPDPLGVGDAVLRARGQVHGTFLVVMGDVYYDEPLGPYIDSWRRSGAEGAVLVEPPGEPSADPVGLVWSSGHRVVRIAKEPFTRQVAWRVAGMFAFPEEAFEVMGELSPAAGGELEIEDVVGCMIEFSFEFVRLPYRGWRRNINRPRDLSVVERRVTTRREAAGSPGPGRT
jgi:dTDP-glucose pyrophosphorylase